MSEPVVILGLGFTTQRLARRLRRRDVPVYAAVRDPARFTEFGLLGVQVFPLDSGLASLPRAAVLIYSVPPLAEPERSAMRNLIRELAPRRILYISSTSVYGAQSDVAAETGVAPNEEKGRARVEEEGWIASCSGGRSLILRSAAIYGPGRGVHVRLREGKVARGNGGVVSRVHVDDLAAILEAGIASSVTGAFPVADKEPAESAEVAAWCAGRMGLVLPDVAATFDVAGRRVDGTKIRELLGAELKYASYREGIDASLVEESETRAA